MKRRFYKSIAMMLTLVLVLGSFSISALAANDEAVLDTVNHTSAISAEVDAQDSTVTLTVPYDYTGDVVLSSGLDISYDTAVYESASAEFPDGATAIVGGAAVRMRITYQRKDDATLSTTEYTVRVVRAAQIAPTFSGTIAKSVSLPNSVGLSVADISERYAQNQGGVLDSIQIAGSDPTFGSLKLGAVSALGKTIKISDLQNGNLTFVPTDTGVVSYTVSAYALGSEEVVGTAILKITVNEAAFSEDVTYTTVESMPIHFQSVDFSNAFHAATGKSLSYVQFTVPASTFGIFYYNYWTATDYDSLVTAEAKYSIGEDPFLSNVDFVPADGFTGTFKIAYTAYSADDTSFEGEITILVNEANDSDHFNDVGKNIKWAVEAIDYLYEHGILTGTGNGYYNPQASISRGDFMLMLSRAFDFEAEVDENFSDMDEDDYYYRAVGAAKKFGITKGAKGKFNPRSALSRQDAMVLLVRALEASDIELPDGNDNILFPFKDKNKISDYAKDAFQALIQAGIIEGSGKALNPNSSVSRAEIAVILYRILTM